MEAEGNPSVAEGLISSYGLKLPLYVYDYMMCKHTTPTSTTTHPIERMLTEDGVPIEVNSCDIATY